MRESLRNMKISFILASILYLVLGVILLVWPETSSTVICYAFGGLLLIYGIITIIGFLIHDSKYGSFRLELFLGIVATALGLLFLLKPKLVLSALPFVLGLYIVIDSLINLKRAFSLRDMGYEKWWLILIFSLVAVGLGILIVVNPFTTAKLSVMVIGGVFFYQGLSDLWAIRQVARLVKAAKNAAAPIELPPLDLE